MHTTEEENVTSQSLPIARMHRLTAFDRNLEEGQEAACIHPAQVPA